MGDSRTRLWIGRIVQLLTGGRPVAYTTTPEMRKLLDEAGKACSGTRFDRIQTARALQKRGLVTIEGEFVHLTAVGMQWVSKYEDEAPRAQRYWWNDWND